MGILSGIRKAGKAAKKASKAATAAKKDKPKTFESEMKELRGKAMTDARRQAEAIKIAKKYNKNISIEGKTFGPKKKKDTPEKAEAERKAAKERVTRRKNKEAAKVTEKKGSIAKKMTVSKTDIQQANTARELSTMQRRVDAMDDGLVKKSMQKMLNAQRKKFEKMQADEVDKAGRKSAQSARDRKPFKGYDPSKDLPFNKGGLAKPKPNQTGLKKLPESVRNKMGYMKRGGVVKSGHTDMRKGGMFYK